MSLKNLKFNSKTIQVGQKPDKAYGAVMPLFYQTSTFSQTTSGGHQGFEYSQSGNPTRSTIEKS
ncbi:PLP-dependent transferase [Aurantibacter crassamenti]|uniref:PLP-dependent transferase n=1 Tax=Aurantibacter crassamenti TaxID=1837375 RepID=UPI001939AB16|nr:PLP-dependent transferase [Aurantibacter crassamenti]